MSRILYYAEAYGAAAHLCACGCVRKSEPRLTRQSGLLRKAREDHHFTRPWATGRSPAAHTTLSETGQSYGAASGRRRRSKWAGVSSISDESLIWIADLRGRSAVASGIGCAVFLSDAVLVATPQRPEAGQGRLRLARAGPDTAPVFRSDCGSGLSLRAETAWLRAHGRLWRFFVRARPFSRIAPGRGLSVATPAALQRSRRRRLHPPLPAYRLRSALTPTRRQVPLDPER